MKYNTQAKSGNVEGGQISNINMFQFRVSSVAIMGKNGDFPANPPPLNSQLLGKSLWNT